MTDSMKRVLICRWAQESDKAWREGRDEECQKYLADLDAREATNQLTKEELEIINRILFDLEPKVDPDLYKQYQAFQAEIALAEALLELRRELLMDQSELAQKTGLSLDEIKKMEMAKGSPRLQTLTRIANATGLTVRISFTKWSP